jgi:hypothetical protein
VSRRIGVLQARDYTGPMILPVKVRTVIAEASAFEDGIVTVSLAGRPSEHRNHVDGGLTWGYEVDLTPERAIELAQQLAAAAAEALEARP